MRNALLVLTTDARIRAVLAAVDPKALAQADAALDRKPYDLLAELVDRNGAVKTLEDLTHIIATRSRGARGTL